VITTVIEFIKANEGSPVSAKMIGKAFGMDDIHVRRIISDARRSGIPICSNSKGYYYSTDDMDIKNTLESLKRRVASIQNAIDGLAKYLEVIT
jgi:biotin operon repressor